MDLLRNILVILHFIGLGSLLGGFLVQMKSFKTKSVVINPAILHGALVQLITGLLLTGVAEAGDDPVNHMKIGIKLVVALAVYVLALANRKKNPVSNSVLGIIGVLTLVNIVVAVVMPGFL